MVAAMATGCVALRSGSLPGTPGDGPDHSKGIRTAQQLRDWSTSWSAIDRNFHSPGFNGLDWRSIEKEVADRIHAGLSEAIASATSCTP
jgi:hypothetical protein